MVERVHVHRGKIEVDGDSQGIHVNGVVQSMLGALYAVQLNATFHLHLDRCVFSFDF